MKVLGGGCESNFESPGHYLQSIRSSGSCITAKKSALQQDVMTRDVVAFHHFRAFRDTQKIETRQPVKTSNCLDIFSKPQRTFWNKFHLQNPTRSWKIHSHLTDTNQGRQICRISEQPQKNRQNCGLGLIRTTYMCTSLHRYFYFLRPLSSAIPRAIVGFMGSPTSTSQTRNDSTSDSFNLAVVHLIKAQDVYYYPTMNFAPVGARHRHLGGSN